MEKQREKKLNKDFSYRQQFCYFLWKWLWYLMIREGAKSKEVGVITWDFGAKRKFLVSRRQLAARPGAG
jgi:hypothetical protein